MFNKRNYTVTTIISVLVSLAMAIGLLIVATGNVQYSVLDFLFQVVNNEILEGIYLEIVVPYTRYIFLAAAVFMLMALFDIIRKAKFRCASPSDNQVDYTLFYTDKSAQSRCVFNLLALLLLLALMVVALLTTTTYTEMIQDAKLTDALSFYNPLHILVASILDNNIYILGVSLEYYGYSTLIYNGLLPLLFLFTVVSNIIVQCIYSAKKKFFASDSLLSSITLLLMALFIIYGCQFSSSDDTSAYSFISMYGWEIVYIVPAICAIMVVMNMIFVFGQGKYSRALFATNSGVDMCMGKSRIRVAVALIVKCAVIVIHYICADAIIDNIVTTMSNGVYISSYLSAMSVLYKYLVVVLICSEIVQGMTLITGQYVSNTKMGLNCFSHSIYLLIGHLLLIALSSFWNVFTGGIVDIFANTITVIYYIISIAVAVFGCVLVFIPDKQQSNNNQSSIIA